MFDQALRALQPISAPGINRNYGRFDQQTEAQNLSTLYDCQTRTILCHLSWFNINPSPRLQDTSSILHVVYATCEARTGTTHLTSPRHSPPSEVLEAARFDDHEVNNSILLELEVLKI